MTERHGLRSFFFSIAVVFIAGLSLAAAFAPVLSGHDPVRQDLEGRLLPPGSRGHLLGTDELGRDIFSRVIHGSRSILLVGLVSVMVALVLGVLVGLAAGLFGGYVDSFLVLVMDSVLSFPTVLLAIAVVSMFGYGLMQVTVALGVVFSPVFGRIVRAETMALLAEGFVESARALGSSMRKIVVLHLIPNMLPKIIVQSSVTLALAVVIESSLSFLGIGAQPPEPSWGLMLKDARNYLFRAPWLALYPGLALAWTVFSFNYLGDVLSEWLNPTL